MSYTGVITLIAIGELLAIALLITIIVLMIKNKRKERIERFNQSQANVEYFKKKINEKGKAVEKAIKKAENTNDFINIYNDIMSNYETDNDK